MMRRSIPNTQVNFRKYKKSTTPKVPFIAVGETNQTPLTQLWKKTLSIMRRSMGSLRMRSWREKNRCQDTAFRHTGKNKKSCTRKHRCTGSTIMLVFIHFREPGEDSGGFTWTDALACFISNPSIPSKQKFYSYLICPFLDHSQSVYGWRRSRP